MTEPDEALRWAKREGYRWFADEIADAYRAGQAASAARIKALEEEIAAARIKGIRLGLEAKMRLEPSSHPALRPRLRMPDPETIAREAVLDQLVSEAEEQGMGYETEADRA